jgi:hypothetical protein
MPAGLPYFAWIDASETTFGPEHLRWDEAVFSFTLSQEEGDPASLTAVVRRPRNVSGDPIGLLGPGRKIWAWFALDCGPALIKFRGRLVGIPTSLFEELVTLEFVARPVDLVAQKEALAETLRVLPYYDPVVLDPPRRKDPDVVLEGYTKIWHFDRETHVITVSDEITGEDGLVEFDGASEDGKVLYDGLGLSLTSGPLTRIDVEAEYSWTQQAVGTVDLTNYLITNGPHQYAAAGAIASYTLTADGWPKIGTGIGDGWEVAHSTCYEGYDLTVHGFSETHTVVVETGDGSIGGTASYSRNTFSQPPGSIAVGGDYSDSYSISYDDDGNATSFSSSFSHTVAWLPLHHIVPTLLAGYKAERQCTEKVSFSLFADVQPILTDPEDGEALRIDDIRSVNLSEAIGDEIPIGDPRRRSYIATERGNRSLEYLLAVARAKLMMRARAVEISFAPKLARMPEISLRKSLSLIEPRVGEAVGKIIGYSIALDGSDGRVNCEIRIGCTIGYGGAQVTLEGTPTYCTVDYVGADYQQFNDRVVMFDPTDTSVGYEPPQANPNDDGINFLGVLRAADVIDIPLVVEWPPEDQQTYILQAASGHSLPRNPAASEAELQKYYESSSDLVGAALRLCETKLIFKLKSMTREFSSDYELQVTDLKIPTGYDLEAT